MSSETRETATSGEQRDPIDVGLDAALRSPIAGETQDDGMTMSVNGGPAVPITALEEIARQREVSGQLSLFEGRRYPDAVVQLAGGVKGFTIDLSDLTEINVGDAFHIEAHGVVAAKKHAVKYDEDGAETRTLTVTLKADSVRAWDATPAD
jgi:hypothetical protein